VHGIERIQGDQELGMGFLAQQILVFPFVPIGIGVVELFLEHLHGLLVVVEEHHDGVGATACPPHAAITPHRDITPRAIEHSEP
jgi:hypothetical protein